ncbi:MAG: hypothetical protein ACFE0O_15030 [Opitutales bacterium]
MKPLRLLRSLGIAAFPLALAGSSAFGQVVTDDDIPAILDGGTDSVTAYYEIGEAANYAFTLSQTGETFFIVGNNNPRNSLTIKNGADADFESGLVTVGAGSDSTHNNFYVTGTGTTASNTGTLRVGTGGSTNNLLSVLTNASVTSGGDVYVGQTTGSDLNQLAVSGAATLTTAANRDVYVGYQGNFNSLRVSSGGQANLSRRLEIGYAGDLNTVQVMGSDSLLAVDNRIQFGRSGGENNTLSISNGGTLTNGNDVTFFGANNAMIINGTGSTATLTGLDLGFNGSTGNTLTVSDGGLLALTQSDVAIEAGNTLRLDGGYIAWLGDRTTNFESFITSNAVEISDGQSGWNIATSDDLAVTYFSGDDTAALNFSGYAGLGDYTILGPLSAVPEPSVFATFLGAGAVGTAALRRRSRRTASQPQRTAS